MSYFLGSTLASTYAVVSRFGRGLRRTYLLALDAHMPELGLLRLRKIIKDVFNFHDRPGKEISVANGLEPGPLGGETGRGVEVADGKLNAEEFVDMVDGFASGEPGAYGFDVVSHLADVRHAVESVEGAAAVGRVQEQDVCVVMFDVGGEGGMPQLTGGVLSPLDDGGLANLYFGNAIVAHVDFAAVVDEDVPGADKLASAEEGGAAQERDHVDGAGRRVQGVPEQADFCRGGGITVSHIEYICGWVACRVKLSGVAPEAGAGDGSRITNDGGNGAIQDALLEKAGCEGAVEAAAVELRFFALLSRRV